MSFPQFQLSDARTDAGIRAVSGVCNNGNAFRDQINIVTRQLMKRGGFFGTEVLVRFCIHSACITLPRYVSTITGARTCCGQSNIKNGWYNIVGVGACCHGFEANATLVDDGTAPIYNEVSGTTGKIIRYHVVKNADIGKSITIYGTMFGGQPLQTQNADGTWRMGVTITASSAGGAVLPAGTTQLVTKITSITREATSGMAYLYEWGPDADGVNALRDLAVYEPSETNPMYRRMKIKGYCGIPGKQDDNGRTIKQLEAMCSLEFVPLVSENDFLLLDDMDALAFGVQAVKYNQAGDAENAEVFFSKAIRELNFLDRKKSPTNQTAVSVNVTGGAMVQNLY